MKTPGKGDIKPDITFYHKMLMSMIDTPEIRKDKDMGSKSSLKVSSSDVKYASKIFLL